MRKAFIKIVNEDDILDVESNKWSNKRIFIPPWTIDVGLLQVTIAILPNGINYLS